MWGVFTLLCECLGRNIHVASYNDENGKEARETNESVIRLIAHRHEFSPAFQENCRTPSFLAPLAQAVVLFTFKF